MQLNSQAALILGYLEAGNTITPLEALEKFGCFRLASRINDLKNEGHAIDGEMIELDNGKRVKRYRMAA